MTAFRCQPTKRWLSIAAVFAVLFGALTIWEGGSVILQGDLGSANAPSYVPFVVRFNFLAGFAYVAAGLDLWFRRAWAPRLALIIFAATLLTFAAFGAYVLSGGAYETRTVIAMTLRTATWAAIAWLAHRVAARRNARTTS